MKTEILQNRRGPKPSPERRAAIEVAALSLFAKQGVAATSTRQIAALAGTTERTLFKYFGTKDVLVAEVLKQASLKAMRPPAYLRMAENLPFTPEEFIAWHRAFLTERVETALHSSDAYRLLFSALFSDRALAQKYIDVWSADVMEPLRKHLSLMRKDGALKSARSDEELAAIFFTLNLGYLVTRFALAGHREWDTASNVEAAIATFATLCGWDVKPADPTA